MLTAISIKNKLDKKEFQINQEEEGDAPWNRDWIDL